MATDQWLGVELAGYRIDELIGRGGAGVVYRATQLRLQRPAAVKLLAPTLTSDAEYRRRFEREARLAAALEHPHIVPIYDAGYAEGALYLAMAYIAGLDLAAAIENGPMELRRVCGLLTGVAEALDSAHHAGLVHRDVKPANVLLTGPGQSAGHDRAYMCDFGIARHTSSSSMLTSTGQFLGTLQYCSPEQIQGLPIDGRTDQYALACVVYHCLTGRAPYSSDEPSAVMFAHIYADPPRASAQVPDLPAAVDDVIARSLAKQPADRFPDCTTFLRALAVAGNAISPVVPLRPVLVAAGTPPPSGTVIWPPAPDRPDPRPATPSPTGNHERRGVIQSSVLGRVLRVQRSAAFALFAAPVVVLALFAAVLVAPWSGDDTAGPSAAPFAAVPPVQLSVPATINVGERVWDLAVSPRGDQIFVGLAESGVAVVDTRSRTAVRTIPAPELAVDVNYLFVSPDGGRSTRST
jgi:serine/threonine protein kinase